MEVSGHRLLPRALMGCVAFALASCGVDTWHPDRCGEDGACGDGRVCYRDFCVEEWRRDDAGPDEDEPRRPVYRTDASSSGTILTPDGYFDQDPAPATSTPRVDASVAAPASTATRDASAAISTPVASEPPEERAPAPAEAPQAGPGKERGSEPSDKGPSSKGPKKK